MWRATQILSKSCKVVEDLNLLQILQSEISHELSSYPFKDVVLWRKSESGEEVAVSALLGPEIYDSKGKFPREVLMKVCVKKPGLSSMLQFDCGVSEKGVHRSDFNIYNAYYLQSSTIPCSSVYRGPLFR
ncbi:hypothetical protein REPUB_Repub02eG0176000 [Reevesia pubescens]